MNMSSWRPCWLVLILLGTIDHASGEEEKAPVELPPIAATLDDDPVYVGEITAALSAVSQNRQPNPKGLPTAKADLLRQILNRRLAERTFRREGGYIKDSDIDKELARVEAQLTAQRKTLAQYAAERGVTVDTMRHDLAWQLGWKQYVDRNLTDGLETYFNEHQKDLDGTQIHARHILLRSDRPTVTTSQLMERAEKIREEIESGKITFENAAEKYSVGPSRRQGGDLGLFPRYGVMVEEFSKPAFALAKGEISKPVASVFGVHLIQVTDVKPGNKKWTEVIERIKQPAAVDLLEKLAAKERETTKIEYTGLAPYFKPGTTELVLPSSEDKKR